MKIILPDYTQEEAYGLMPELKKYTVRQIYAWLPLGKEFEEMTDVAKSVRSSLAERFIAQPVVISKVYTGKDGTEKYLYKLQDGALIEGVLMRYKYGNTLCVSTQVGCRMGCRFCASTLDGLIRNLSAGEILGQVYAVNGRLGATRENRQITNIVLMGSGEPLDNFDNTVRFLRMVNDENGLNIAMRNISLSTCGLVPEIERLSQLGLQINLTISLHEAYNEKRKEIMPIANKYTVEEVVNAARRYFENTGRRIIFEYTLIQDFNDTEKDAEKLAVLIRGMSAHVNLIMLNPVEERKLVSATKKRACAFFEKLTKLGVSNTIRRSLGADIEGACGQLRRRVGNE